MPTPLQILDGLTATSNQWMAVAVLWHVSLAYVVICLIAGQRLPQRVAATRLCFPLISVSVAAIAFSNLFNGLVFSILAVALFSMARRLAGTAAACGPMWSAAVGVLMVAFGWVYPHFLSGVPSYMYLIAAPFGLIPCPTLSVIVGFALLANGFRSLQWSLTLGLAGLVYGLFGAFRLGVQLDLVLVLGAAVLLLLAIFQLRRSAG